MNRIALVVTLLGGGWALACEEHHGAHGQVGSAGINVHLGQFAMDLVLSRHPCAELVVAQAELPPEPQYYEPEEQFSPPPVVAAPVMMAAPVVIVAPSAGVHAVPEEAEPERPARLALKWMPGASSVLALNDGVQVGPMGFSQTAGLELRLGRYFALRSDLELRPDGRSFDVVGVKLALLPDWKLRPYGSVSLALSDTPGLPGHFNLGLMGAAGLDLYFGRHFFIEAEVRYRRVPTCCQDEPRLTALVGAGVAFF